MSVNLQFFCSINAGIENKCLLDLSVHERDLNDCVPGLCFYSPKMALIWKD